VFAGRKDAKLAVNVASARLLSSDVALGIGTTEITPANGGPGTIARFSAVLVKKDGEWFFESVRDSVALPPSNAAYFEGIDWLIGDWVGENVKGESGTSSYARAENQNFIVSTFAPTLNGIPVFGGTHVYRRRKRRRLLHCGRPVINCDRAKLGDKLVLLHITRVGSLFCRVIGGGRTVGTTRAERKGSRTSM
jgi:hypothetical protein